MSTGHSFRCLCRRAHGLGGAFGGLFLSPDTKQLSNSTQRPTTFEQISDSTKRSTAFEQAADPTSFLKTLLQLVPHFVGR